MGAPPWAPPVSGFEVCRDLRCDPFRGIYDRVSYSAIQGIMAQEQERDGTVYTCPMDPDVRQHEPGTCPQCGMELEPAED